MARTTATPARSRVAGAPAAGSAVQQVHHDQDLLQAAGDLETVDFPLTAFVWE